MMATMVRSGTGAGDKVRVPVTVFVHIHYPDIWHEMCVILAERLTSPFHLVLTHTGDAALPVPATPWLAGVRQLPVENRGRDVRPFLQALAETSGFDVGLKLHTKKSPQRTDGARWRAHALHSLLPREGSEAAIARLRADTRIGLVAPAGLSLSVEPWVLVNAPGMVRIMATLGIELVDSALEDAYFAAGSMFWFRRAAIETLAAPEVLDLFEDERGQLDGTIAHAMERIFPVEARRHAYVSLAMPALMESTSRCTPAELIALARRYADTPQSYFPIPGIAALPPPDKAVPRRWGGLLGGLLRRRT